MRLFFLLPCFLLLPNVYANLISGILDDMNKVLIETLPTRTVILDMGKFEMSYDIPVDLVNTTDTIIFNQIFEELGCFGGYRFNRTFIASDTLGTKILRGEWEFRMCGLTSYRSEYPQNFCAERLSNSPYSFTELLLSDQLTGKYSLKNSLIELPFVSNPWVKLPHYEYRQCFRYAQSLFAMLRRIPNQGKKRFLHVRIQIIVPDSSDFRSYYIAFWSTSYTKLDLLRMKRLMNSFNIIYKTDCGEKIKTCSDLLIRFEALNERNTYAERVARDIFSRRR